MIRLFTVLALVVDALMRDSREFAGAFNKVAHGFLVIANIARNIIMSAD